MAKKIEVLNNGECGTFIKDNAKNTAEFSSEIASLNPKDVALNCRAGICLFNRNGRCCANGITITGGKQSADCATFIER
jgi:hypothetical protein